MTGPDRGPVILAVDQGTSSTKGVALAASGRVVAEAARPLGQRHPRPGWVEQDPEDLAAGVEAVLAELAARVRDLGGAIAGTALSTQRESALAWDTATGEPRSPVLGWQDRRTAARAADLQAGPQARRVRELSGLPVDPMFSALKLAWILDQIDPGRSQAEQGSITLGTVDAWLVHRLTGERRIELGNASRTQLLDYRRGAWSDELLGIFDVPRAALPDLADSDRPTVSLTHPDLGSARILAVLGDSHAALFGHGIRGPGEVKVTYGTGSSVMALAAGAADGVVDTIAWSLSGTPTLAVEGNILATGATLVWLARLLDTTPEALLELAVAAPSGVLDLVPAFAGLGAPWWDPSAVGLVSGLTLGTDRADLARAAAESIVLQVEDVLAAVERPPGDQEKSPIATIHADGGPSANDWLMGLQADLTGRVVVRPRQPGLSALGAAWLAGSVAGLWSRDEAPWASEEVDRFEPRLPADQRRARQDRWCQAVNRARWQSRRPKARTQAQTAPTSEETTTT